jgi:tetratricopeptide (TPR) repeat protein
LALPSDPSASPPRLPDYRVDRPLGRGGFGVVWAGVGGRDGSPVAIKVGWQDQAALRERFLREAAALDCVGPPCAPRLYQSGVLADGRPYLVLELLRPPSLGQLLDAAAGPLGASEAKVLFDALLLSVEAIHRAGLVHGDLTPANLFVEGSRPLVRVIDFGLTVPVGEPASQRRVVAGTPEYIAPERWQPDAPADPRSDLYSIGVLLVEALTGRLPFFGGPGEIEQAHRAARPPRLCDRIPVAPALDELVLSCLAKTPAQRPADAAALRRALIPLLSEPAPPSRPLAPAPDAPSRPPERRTAALLGFVSGGELSEIDAVAADLGGQIVQARAGRYLLAFLPGAADPLERALACARSLTTQAGIDRVLVDVAVVPVATSAAGAPRIVGAGLDRPQRFPQSGDPVGVLLTAAAVRLCKDAPLAEDAPGSGRFQLLSANAPDERSLQAAAWGRPPLTGRDATLAELCADAQAAITLRRPAIATVIAAAGHGKTHLCAALIDAIGERCPSAPLVVLQAGETLGGLLMRLLGAPPPAAGRQRLVERLGPAAESLWEGTALALGWLAADAPAVRALGAVPDVLHAQAVRAAALALRGLAAEGALVLVDDGHLADAGVLDALELATLAEANAPLWVCLLARPGFAQARPAWGQRAARRLSVDLAPLDRAACATLVRGLLAPARDVPDVIVERLVARTQGVPLLLVELCRGLLRDGLLRRSSRGVVYVASDEIDRLPQLPLVEWLAQRELAGLPAELARVTELAAVLGLEFGPDELAGVVAELDREDRSRSITIDPHVAARELASLGVLSAQPGGRLGFRHGLLRDAIVQGIPAAVRRTIHVAALRYYQAAGGQGDDPLSRIAVHAAAGGEPLLAFEASRRLAERAADRHAWLDTELAWSDALAQLGEGEQGLRMQALAGRGLARYRLCRYQDALADLETARQLAETLGDHRTAATALLDAATALDWMGEYRRSSELVEEAAREAQELTASERSERSHATGGSAEVASVESGSPLLAARVLVGQGRSQFRFDALAKAQSLLEEAARRAEQLGGAAHETLAIALVLGGYVEAELGHLDAAERTFERAVALCENRGDRLHLGAALGNRAQLWIGRQDHDRLIADLRRLLELAREMGNARMEQQAQVHLARYLHWLGEREAAERHARSAIAIDEYMTGQLQRPEAELILARVLVARGRRQEASDQLRVIERRRAGARSQGYAELELLPSEQVQFEMVEASCTLAAATTWDALEARACACLSVEELAEFRELRGLAAAATLPTDRV